MSKRFSGIIFLAGIYGVGKSTLAAKLSTTLHIPEYSASDLISTHNSEIYGQNKFVKDPKNNQLILIAAACRLLEKYPTFILSGHFCIFNQDYSVQILPTTFFEEANIRDIILLKADVSKIIQNLENRDGKTYNTEALFNLQKTEINQATKIATSKNIPLKTYDMLFSNEDIFNVSKILAT